MCSMGLKQCVLVRVTLTIRVSASEPTLRKSTAEIQPQKILATLDPVLAAGREASKLDSSRACYGATNMGRDSRRSVSEKLMRAPQVAPGSRIFVEVADVRSWVAAEVVRQENTLLYCRDAAGNAHDVDLGFMELLYQNEPGTCSDGSYDDMTAMLHIHEPGMLDNLRRRVRITSLRYVQ